MENRPQRSDGQPPRGKCILWILMILLLPACAHLSKGAAPIDGSPSIALRLMAFYQGPLDHLRAVRGGECPMAPTCSEYCRQAFEKHGFLMGWLMSVDRLLRCGRDELRISPHVFINGEQKTYDPLDANDFWWAPSPLEKRYAGIGLRGDVPQLLLDGRRDLQ